MKYFAYALSLAVLSGCATNSASRQSQEQANRHQQQLEQQQAEQQQQQQAQANEVVVQSEPRPHESEYIGYHRDLNSFWGFWGPWNGGFFFPAYYGSYAGSLHAEFRGDYSQDASSSQSPPPY